jgi:hypothetical protein
MEGMIFSDSEVPALSEPLLGPGSRSWIVTKKKGRGRENVNSREGNQEHSSSGFLYSTLCIIISKGVMAITCTINLSGHLLLIACELPFGSIPLPGLES